MGGFVGALLWKGDKVGTPVFLTGDSLGALLQVGEVLGLGDEVVGFDVGSTPGVGTDVEAVGLVVAAIGGDVENEGEVDGPVVIICVGDTTGEDEVSFSEASSRNASPVSEPNPAEIMLLSILSSSCS